MLSIISLVMYIFVIFPYLFCLYGVVETCRGTSLRRHVLSFVYRRAYFVVHAPKPKTHSPLLYILSILRTYYIFRKSSQYIANFSVSLPIISARFIVYVLSFVYRRHVLSCTPHSPYSPKKVPFNILVIKIFGHIVYFVYFCKLNMRLHIICSGNVIY